MTRPTSWLLALSLASLCCVPTNSQTPAAGKKGNQGVNPTQLMDRKEVRVSRVEIQPGAVRAVHTHDDVRFHLWIPVSGQLEITIGSAKPVDAMPGQAYFMEKGTPHGFRNTGTSLATVMEVFVKDGSTAARADALGAALALAGQ
jgi:quercetin dioxygenase-like cupin family protein